jgi:SOS-response transcriptional repressor LexA
MASLGVTIRHARRSAGLTLEELATRVGCAKSYLSTIENDARSRPPADAFLHRVEHAVGAAPNSLVALARWAATPGEVKRRVADMETRERLASRLVSLLRDRGVDAAHQSGELRRLVERLAPEANVEQAGLGAPVQAPIVNSVSAGYPREFTDMGYPARVAEEYISAPGLTDPEAFAARVVGDSMAPRYLEGDVVIFSPAMDTPEGADCFVRFEPDGETTFKRIYFETGDDGGQLIRLQPLNAAYPPRVLPREHIGGMYAAAYVVRPVARHTA